MATKKKTVTLVDDTGEVAGLAVAGAVTAEPTITQAQIDEMRSAEAATLDYLKACPTRSEYVPRGLFGGAAVVIYNAIRFDYVEGQSHDMPEPVADLFAIRRAAAELTAPK